MDVTPLSIGIYAVVLFLIFVIAVAVIVMYFNRNSKKTKQS